jgi:hypothetical protein
VATTKLLLSTGDQLEVVGAVGEVAKILENSSRSSSGTLAWLTDQVSKEQVGINPAQVAMVRAGEE